MGSPTELPSPLVGLLERAYRRLQVQERGVLLAVSGGKDSLALLFGTLRVKPGLGLRVEVATLDHGLRPESASELQGVADACARQGVPFHGRRLEVQPGAGLEARAREKRYQALEALRQERGLDVVATAHTANDQAETLLMRLARGASTRGLGSIHEQRERLVRPLLEVTRAQVETFLAEQGQVAAHDPMNDDEAFFRVRVRKAVLPSLEAAFGPGVARRMARAARVFAEDERLLDAMAQAAFGRATLGPGALDAVSLRAMTAPIQRRVLAMLFQRSGVPVDFDSLEDALGAVREQRTATLGRDKLLKSSGGRVRVETAPSRRPLRDDLSSDQSALDERDGPGAVIPLEERGGGEGSQNS